MQFAILIELDGLASFRNIMPPVVATGRSVLASKKNMVFPSIPVPFSNVRRPVAANFPPETTFDNSFSLSTVGSPAICNGPTGVSATLS